MHLLIPLPNTSFVKEIICGTVGESKTTTVEALQ
jgi:hypothetical protein